MPETSDHASAAPAETTLLDPSTDSHVDALYRAAIGPMGADYYLPILARFEAYGRASPSWNGAASINTLNWMALRGLWMPALLYLAALAAGILAVAAIVRFAAPMAESVQWSLWAALATVALLVPGFFGNAWLYRVYRKRMDSALASTPSLKDACMLLARQSSSRPRLVAIVAANLALVLLLATAFWPSDLRTRMWPRVSGDIDSVAAAASAPATATHAATEPASAPATSASEPEANVPPAAPAASAAAASASASASSIAPSIAPSIATAASAAATPPESPASAPRDTPSAAPAPVPAQATTTQGLPDVDPQALGPAARSAAQQQATLAARSRAARNRPPPEAAAPTPAVQSQAPSAAAPASAAQGGRYLINVGLFAQQDNALRAHAKLKVAGLPAISESLQTRNGQRTRVRVGPFATRAQADAAAERIRALQLDAVVVRQ